MYKEYYIEDTTFSVETFSDKNINQLMVKDKPIHDWYRFVLSYPPHLVRTYIQDFSLTKECTILDPFCGTGTTIIEAKFNNINSIGIEANPFPFFASTTKIDWNICIEDFLKEANEIAETANNELQKQGINDYFLTQINGHILKSLNNDINKLLIKDSISPIPMHKTLILLEMHNKKDLLFYLFF